ncbi:MAG: hypothetical protein ACLQDL_14675 [Spirochaetia bacterium]
MISSFASGIVPWLIPPACGALVGAALGYSVIGRLSLPLLLRNRSVVSRAAGNGVEALTRWALMLRVGDLAIDRKSAAARSLESVIAESLGGVLRSRAVIYAVRDAMFRIVSGLAQRRVRDLSNDLGFPGFLAAHLLPTISREENRQAVGRAAALFVTRQAGPMLTDDVLREISSVFESYIPEAVDALVRWLRSGETRAYLSERGRELIPRILEKLSELQKLFITAGQFDRKLNEKMPEIVDDTIGAAEKMMRDSRQQERIAGVFLESAQGWRDSLLVTPTDGPPQRNDPRRKLSDSAAALLDRFLGSLADPQTRQSMAGFAAERLDEDPRTLGAFVYDTLRIRDSEIVEILSARALDLLIRPETARSISRQLCGLLFDFVEDHAQATIGEVLRIDVEKKRALDESLRARLPRLLEGVIPGIAASVPRSIRAGALSAVVGACVGFVTGVALQLLRLLGLS